MLLDDVKMIVGSALQLGSRLQQMSAAAPLLRASSHGPRARIAHAN
jgi:hypothetical protein